MFSGVKTEKQLLPTRTGRKVRQILFHTDNYCIKFDRNSFSFSVLKAALAGTSRYVSEIQFLKAPPSFGPVATCCDG